MTEILRSVSPADPGDELGRFPIAGTRAVDAAVARARAAFPAWREAGLDARAAVLRRFADLVRERHEALARLIAREVGKALWDARGEASLLPAKVEATLSDGLRFVSGFRAGAEARVTYHPRGVLAVLGPFNFPAHLPNGHVVPALATGNTVVVKPSDLAPAVAEWMALAWREAGLPPGALEVVHGGAATGAALARHEDVDGVLFTGSWSVGRALAEASLDQPGKILALEMGGKNAMVVLADADLELAVAEAALSICATTGQRCSCLARIFVEEPALEPFAEGLARALARVRVGPPLDESVFMGPLVSVAGFEKVARYRALAAEAGGERVALPAPDLGPPYVGPGLVRFAAARQTHPYQRDEIFGPEAALYPVADLDQAIEAVNDSDYGLVASVLTRNRKRYEHCIGRIRTGLLNWNRGTIGASGRLPFGGRGRSGNDRPAGILATVYCSVPQAHLENEDGLDPERLPPGNAAPVNAEALAAGTPPHDWRRAILMGDPSHFSVKGGANPHTRTALGTRRHVNRERAIRQWQRLRDLLRELGVRILVVPPDPAQPGLVYPANAGFLTDLDAEELFQHKTFRLSNLIETRAGERPHYERVLHAAGYRTAAVPHRYRFEGEADFFPAGGRYLLTHGRLLRQRFVPRLGFPPWKRIYGFRTDARVESVLAPVVAPARVLRLELVLEAHYHGDTALCAFGPEREHLLVWPAALAPEAQARVREAYGPARIELGDEDAARYAANSFTLTRGEESFLVMPDGLSERLLAQVRERGVRPVCVDVSEFLKKGGGSVKCMIGDLGPVPEELPLGPHEWRGAAAAARAGRAP